VQASNPFRLGDSGGGIFNEAGELVGVIAVKSPGKRPNYYNMSVEWLKPLLQQAVLPFESKSKVAFWGGKPKQWPYFMKVVHPMKTKAWGKLNKIAAEWMIDEPKTQQAKYYLAVSEFELGHINPAENMFKSIVADNAQHGDALYYLGVIAQQQGQYQRARSMLAKLKLLADEEHMSALSEKLALIE